MSQFSRYRWKHARSCFTPSPPKHASLSHQSIILGRSQVFGLAIADAIAGYRTPAAIGQRAGGAAASDTYSLRLTTY